MIRQDKILFIPSARTGNGTGHLKRCSLWASTLPVQNFYIPYGPGIIPDIQIEELTGRCPEKKIYRNNPGRDWDLLILDNRSTEKGSLHTDLDNIPFIAVDEGGEIRDNAPYLLDILPGIYKYRANSEGLNLLELERGEGFYPAGDKLSNFKRVLVSFGGEDPADLSSRLVDTIPSETSGQAWQIVQGPAFHKKINYSGNNISVITKTDSLKPYIRDCDLVLCSYGITAFEAVAAGKPVLLLNPSSYHDRLARKAGFPFMKKAWRHSGKNIARKYFKQIQSEDFQKKSRNLQEIYRIHPEVFSQWVKNLTPSMNRCPVCGSKNNPALYRNPTKTYFHCGSPRCRMVYMVNFREVKSSDIYNSEYFFEDYRKQYGKTYIQDFEHIENMGRTRLNHIGKMASFHRSLLDIGCAYGPFLSASAERGYECYGIDVIQGGVEYIREHYPEIHACISSIEDFDSSGEFQKPSFDIITLWYVIEHFKNLNQILEKIAGLLNDKGILAFSTPNGKGVSAVMDRKRFYENSPDDHYTVWDVRSVRKILKKYGFGKIRIVHTGFHPERIPWKLPFRSFLDRTVLLRACQIFGWGDTFEIYAIKKGKK